MTTTALPHVDEHRTSIEAGAGDVWHALLHAMGGRSSGAVTRGYARLVGCTDTAPAGPRPLAEGSAVPGFHVSRAVPGSELVLEGRHRFSTYALIFRLEPLGDRRTLLRAETRATFPGIGGRAYLLVLRTGAHALAVRRLLAGIRRHAERGART